MQRKKKRGGDKGPRKKRVDIRGEHKCPECLEVFDYASGLGNHMVTHGYVKPVPELKKRKVKAVPLNQQKRVSRDIGGYVQEENVQALERMEEQYEPVDDIMEPDPFMPSVSDVDSDDSDSDIEELEEELEGGLLSGSDASNEEYEDVPEGYHRSVEELAPTAEELASAANDEDFLQKYYEPFLCGDLFKRPPKWDYNKIKELAMKPTLDVIDFEDVEMGDLNVKLMRFTEQAGLSGECQMYLHSILLEVATEEHLQTLLTPQERINLASRSEQKGLEYKSSNPTENTMYTGCQIEMGNILEAALKMLKNPILQESFVSFYFVANHVFVFLTNTVCLHRIGILM